MHCFSTCLMSKLKSGKSHQDRLDYKFVIGQMGIMHLRKQIAHLGFLQRRVCKQLALIICRVKGKRKIPPSPGLEFGSN